MTCRTEAASRPLLTSMRSEPVAGSTRAMDALEAFRVRTISSRMKSRASRGSSVALTKAPTR
jgi:hypothetical protein